MGEDLRLGRVAGVSVGASWSVLVIAALLTWIARHLGEAAAERALARAGLLSGADPVDELVTGTLSVEGLRSLRAHMERLKDRLAARDAS